MSVTDLKGTPQPSQTVVIERGPVANFAESITDPNPVFRSLEAAKEAGFDAIPTPPTWNLVMHNWGAFPELQDPTQAELPSPVTQALGMLMRDGGMILHGEQAFTYTRPVMVGETLTSRGSIKDVTSKESKGKTMTFVVAETEWLDADGEVVCTATMTLIHRK